MDWPCHVAAQGIASEQSFLSPHDQDHLRTDGFSFDFIHLQF
jgi:hypothetical protein